MPDVLEKAFKLGQPAIAMTDHGNMHGAVDFFNSAKKIGIKPIIGCELYMTPGSRLDRRTKDKGGAGTHHLTVLAKNTTGYKNLCRLVTLAYREGFYFKPRVDYELLRQCSSGLIVLSGCLAGELNGAVETDDIARAKDIIRGYASIFGEDFYLEVQPHKINEQQKLNSACFDLAKDLGIPLVATNDCHYPNEDDHYAQEVLMCVSTAKLITDPDRIQHKGVHLHLKSVDEMLSELSNFPQASEAINNSVLIAESVNFEFEKGKYYMPKFEPRPGSTLSEMMSELATAGLQKRFDEMESRGQPLTSQVRELYESRLSEELELIEKMGFSGYFLVVSDFIVWAKENGIPVGPGRGSCAGSLVSYAMRITEIDPIPNKLLFERFLNPERVSLPDIDVDFCILGRDRVIQYVTEKYGREKVAQIATFGTLKAKAVIKDVGRALGMSYAETDRIAGLIPAPRQGFDYPLADSIKMEPRLAEYAKGEGKELITLGLKLEGLVRHTSTHAAGVVIGDRELVELLPLFIDKDGNEVTQYPMTAVEKIGLVKFDFLGLKTLTVIHTALKIIKESLGIDIDIDQLPLDDSKTYDLLCAGNTTGVFQLESGGITDMTVRLKPNCFDDLVAILALYRPGPLDAGMVDHYINRKHKREAVTYLHPKMADILEDTYGIIVYQEQIMQLARELAGYSLGEADLLRRAMGKKNPIEMAKQREIFTKRAIERSIADKLATEIFDQMETFARYGFNRSHSAAYAMVSYQTAYLKAHYPVQFMAALMSLEMGDSDKTLKNINECREQQIRVLPPDVNKSNAGFTVTEGMIRFGLEAVKGIGEKAVQVMITEREANGEFVDLEDYAARVDYKAINRRVVENLVKCGAFDFSGVSRREMSERLDEVLRAAQSIQRESETNQIGLFSPVGGRQKIARRSTDRPEWPVNQKLTFEREALGFYISGHPVEKFRRELRSLGAKNTGDLSNIEQTCQVKVGGVVTALRLKNTKKGDRYATFGLEDWCGTVETIVWPRLYTECASQIVANDPILITGKLDVNEQRRTLIAEKVESVLSTRDKSASMAIMEIKANECSEDFFKRLEPIFKKHNGTCPVLVSVEEVKMSVQLKNEYSQPICVRPSEILCEEIEEIVGRPVFTFM